jgi:hypothetical protein
MDKESDGWMDGQKHVTTVLLNGDEITLALCEEGAVAPDDILSNRTPVLPATIIPPLSLLRPFLIPCRWRC